MSAWICGVIGVVSSLVLGTQVLELSWVETLSCILGAILAGLVAVFTVTYLERQAWVKTKVLRKPLATWLVFLTIFFAILFLVGPPMREPRVFVWLFVPIVLSTGFTILIFGPIQDRIVARAQARARKLN